MSRISSLLGLSGYSDIDASHPNTNAVDADSEGDIRARSCCVWTMVGAAAGMTGGLLLGVAAGGVFAGFGYVSTNAMVGVMTGSGLAGTVFGGGAGYATTRLATDCTTECYKKRVSV